METKCPVCGAPMQNNICGYCGYNAGTGTQQVNINIQAMPNPGVSSKSKIVALLLCIFLGTLGIHRFYVGKIGTGILYLLTGALFGIGWIVDIIWIAVGSFKDKDNLPLCK